MPGLVRRLDSIERRLNKRGSDELRGGAVREIVAGVLAEFRAKLDARINGRPVEEVACVHSTRTDLPREVVHLIANLAGAIGSPLSDILPNYKGGWQ